MCWRRVWRLSILRAWQFWLYVPPPTLLLLSQYQSAIRTPVIIDTPATIVVIIIIASAATIVIIRMSTPPGNSTITSSGPGNAVSQVCACMRVCVCVIGQQLLGKVTFTLDIWHAGLHWHCQGQSEGRGLKSKSVATSWKIYERKSNYLLICNTV